MLNRKILEKIKVRTTAEFEQEYDRIVRPKPNSKQIDKKLLVLLRVIYCSPDPSVFCRHQCIEKLHDAAGLFSLRLKVGCNVRVLFSIDKNGTILLHSFEERAGKGNTDYSSAIPVAKSRLESLKGGKK